MNRQGGAENHNGGPGRDISLPIPEQITPVIKKFLVRLIGIETGVNPVKEVPVPTKTSGVKSVFEQHPFERLAIPSVGGSIAKHPFGSLHLRFIVAAALAQEGTPDIAVQINGFTRASISLIYGRRELSCRRCRGASQ